MHRKVAHTEHDDDSYQHLRCLSTSYHLMFGRRLALDGLHALQVTCRMKGYRDNWVLNPFSAALWLYNEEEVRTLISCTLGFVLHPIPGGHGMRWTWIGQH